MATGMLPRWWCRITGRHRGQVDYINGIGPWWMCDNCGEIIR